MSASAMKKRCTWLCIVTCLLLLVTPDSRAEDLPSNHEHGSSHTPEFNLEVTLESSSGIPDWSRCLPHDSKWYYAIGVAAKREIADKTLVQACNHGFSNLSKGFKSKVLTVNRITSYNNRNRLEFATLVYGNRGTISRTKGHGEVVHTWISDELAVGFCLVRIPYVSDHLRGSNGCLRYARKLAGHPSCTDSAVVPPWLENVPQDDAALFAIGAGRYRFYQQNTFDEAFNIALGQMAKTILIRLQGYFQTISGKDRNIQVRSEQFMAAHKDLRRVRILAWWPIFDTGEIVILTCMPIDDQI
jgi:hypothetical protein